MTRHPSTEGNNLSPNRVDAKDDVTVPDGQGGRRSFRDFSDDVNEQIEESEAKTIERAEELALIL